MDPIRLDAARELLTAARGHVQTVAPGVRSAALVATKIDEALLWLEVLRGAVKLP